MDTRLAKQIGALASSEETDRVAAVEAIAKLDPDWFSAHAVKLLEDASPKVRYAVVSRSYLVKGRDVLLHRALEDPAAEVRTCAAQGTYLLTTGGWAGPLAKALEAVPAKSGEKGLDWYRLLTEEKIIGALICCKDEPDLARHTARLTPRLLELAGDENAYDPDNALEAGRYAAVLIAITGVPREHIPALVDLLERDGIVNHVRKQFVFALVQSHPEAAQIILAAALKRAKTGKSRLLISDIEAGIAAIKERLHLGKHKDQGEEKQT